MQLYSFYRHPCAHEQSQRGLWPAGDQPTLSCFQGIPSLIPFEAGLKELFPNLRALRANLPKRTPDLAAGLRPEVITGLVVHRPVIGCGVLFGLAEPVAKIVEPFLDLILSAVSEAPAETREVEGYLSSVDDDAFNWASQDDLGGKGIERHLVVGFVLSKVP